VVQIEEDPTGGKLAAQMGKLGGAPHKLDNSIQFHVGDTITALARATMQPGGSEVLLYGTIMGGIGAFFPFQAKEVRRKGQAAAAITVAALLSSEQ
jgi:splicing factor 3B subunit 3